MERRTSSLCLSWTGGYIHFVLTPHRALRFGLRPVQAAGRAAARATPPPSPRRKIASAAPAAAGPQPRPPAPPAALFELSAMVDSGHDSLGRTEWAVLWSRTEPARWSRTPTAPSPVSSLATTKGGAGSAAAATEEDGAGSFFRKFPSVPVRTIILARKLSGEDEAQTPNRGRLLRALDGSSLPLATFAAASPSPGGGSSAICRTRRGAGSGVAALRNVRSGFSQARRAEPRKVWPR